MMLLKQYQEYIFPFILPYLLFVAEHNALLKVSGLKLW